MTGTVAVQVQVRELEDGVWVAVALPIASDGTVTPCASPAASEWRTVPRFVAARARVAQRFVWTPSASGLGSYPWLGTAARAAIYTLLERASARCGVIA